MSLNKIKGPPENLIIEEDRTQQALFPDVFELTDLKINKQLPLPQFLNIDESFTTNKTNINILVEICEYNKNFDLYLFVDGIKKDMYYQVELGKHLFKNIGLKSGKNLIESFYRTGSSKSTSIFSVVNRES